MNDLDKVLTEIFENKIENYKDEKDVIKFKEGDKVKIVRGDYKDLNLKECTFLYYVKNTNIILLQIDKYNKLYVEKDNIELIKSKIERYNTKLYDKIATKTVVVNVIQNNEYKFVDVSLNKIKYFRENFINDKDIRKSIKKAYYELMKSFYEEKRKNKKYLI